MSEGTVREDGRMREIDANWEILAERTIGEVKSRIDAPGSKSAAEVLDEIRKDAREATHHYRAQQLRKQFFNRNSGKRLLAAATLAAVGVLFEAYRSYEPEPFDLGARIALALGTTTVAVLLLFGDPFVDLKPVPWWLRLGRRGKLAFAIGLVMSPMAMLELVANSKIDDKKDQRLLAANDELKRANDELKRANENIDKLSKNQAHYEKHLDTVKDELQQAQDGLGKDTQKRVADASAKITLLEKEMHTDVEIGKHGTAAELQMLQLIRDEYPLLLKSITTEMNSHLGDEFGKVGQRLDSADRATVERHAEDVRRIESLENNVTSLTNVMITLRREIHILLPSTPPPGTPPLSGGLTAGDTGSGGTGSGGTGSGGTGSGGTGSAATDPPKMAGNDKKPAGS